MQDPPAIAYSSPLHFTYLVLIIVSPPFPTNTVQLTLPIRVACAHYLHFYLGTTPLSARTTKVQLTQCGFISFEKKKTTTRNAAAFSHQKTHMAHCLVIYFFLFLFSIFFYSSFFGQIGNVVLIC